MQQQKHLSRYPFLKLFKPYYLDLLPNGKGQELSDLLHCLLLCHKFGSRRLPSCVFFSLVLYSLFKSTLSDHGCKHFEQRVAVVETVENATLFTDGRNGENYVTITVCDTRDAGSLDSADWLFALDRLFKFLDEYQRAFFFVRKSGNECINRGYRVKSSSSRFQQVNSGSLKVTTTYVFCKRLKKRITDKTHKKVKY